MTQGGRQTHQRQERKSDLMSSFSRGSLRIKEESCQVKHDDGITLQRVIMTMSEQSLFTVSASNMKSNYVNNWFYAVYFTL